MSMQREDLIDLIANYKGDHVFNPWSTYDPLDSPDRWSVGDRRLRLLRHFSCFPRFLLIGEAPGYQGCHFSGVPFTNEALLCEGVIPRVGKCERFTTREKPWREPSATIVWRELHRLGIAASTCMWNAFAWHPHKPGNLMSNRKPTRDELLGGAHVLQAVLKYFEGTRVIAVGNEAEWTLDRLGVKPEAKVRHPSMGGANKFREQLSAIVGAQTMNTPEASPYGGTRYQRMDPQPTQTADISTPSGRQFRVNVEPPSDLIGAQPWKDRDGEWYWRAPIVN